ncbi:MAG: hypothetical protein EPO62_05230 [Candidatus Nitrosotenuis sp.]|nr:MAG: hypothetical protein EPO62_05230 [Candidatus Nitrosotenuis sp.]
MTSTETIDLTVSGVEARSIASIANKAVQKIEEFASRHGCSGQFDKTKLKDDLIIFLAKRDALHLEELQISILGDGSVGVGGVVTGKRTNDLILRFGYSNDGRFF